MTLMLLGATADEQARGFESAFAPIDPPIQVRVSLSGNVASIDFDDLHPAMQSTTASAGVLLWQLRDTIFQFEGITEAQLTMEGSCDTFWNWLEMSCGPLRPRN
jgi:hypothetical protein